MTKIDALGGRTGMRIAHSSRRTGTKWLVITSCLLAACFGTSYSIAQGPVYQDSTKAPEVRARDFLRRMTLTEKIAQLTNDAPANERLGIPAMKHGEVLHGVVVSAVALKQLGLADGAGPTIFPIPIALGSTWDPALVKQVAGVIAEEARSVGIEHAYGPVLDVARDPRFGRSEETFGEDPYLVTRMGVAYVEGLQGMGASRFDNRHLLATGKHFAGYQAGTGGLNGAYVDVSKRTMYETFFPPFEAAVKEAGLAAIMPAHSDLDGIPAHMNPWLLDDVLRKQWNFKGFVVSDNIDVYRLFSMHRIARNEAEAAILALKAGVDMELDLSQGKMHSTYQETLASSVQHGWIQESYVDTAALRVLEAKFELGLFDHPEAIDPKLTLGSSAHRQLSLQAAEKAIVLLKNDGILPLSPTSTQKIAIIGPHGHFVEYGGYTGTGHLPGVSFDVALRQALPAASIQYAEGVNVTGADRSGIASAVDLARSSDLVILALGESQTTCGEGFDRDELELPGLQQDLFDQIATTGKPIVTVLVNGCPLTIGQVVEKSRALLEGWYLGSESGTALSEAIIGKTNPGGKLTITFPRSLGQLPSYYQTKAAFDGLGRGKYIENDSRALFPFGFGLSYTTFNVANIRLSADHIRANGSTTLTVDVTNTGELAGDEVVQLYVSPEFASVGHWEKLLKGFERVTLQPGETKTLAFPVGEAQLSIWNAQLQRVVEPGQFSLRIGTSSDQLQTVKLNVDGDGSDPFLPSTTIRAITDADDAEVGAHAKKPSQSK